MKYSKKNKIILGTANFGYDYKTISQKKKISKKEINQILKFAKIKNIVEFDTAANYKGVEKLIGKFIKKNKSSNQWKIITKLKYNKNTNFYSAISKSIKNLNINPYAILAHDLKTYKNKNFHKALDSFKKIKRGISVYEKSEAISAIEYRKPEIIQFPINLFDQRFVKNNFLKYLKKNNIETHARSIFLKGALYNNNKNTKKNNEVLYKTIIKMSDYLDKYKISLSEKSLLDAFNNKNIDKLVIGIDNVGQLERNIRIVKKKDAKVLKLKIKLNLNFKYTDPRKWN